MKTLRVLLYGFCNMAEYIFAPMIREMVGVRDVEVVYTMKDLVKADSSQLVDILAFNAMAIGYNMDRQLQRIKLQFPESFIICLSAYRLSDFICMKLIKNGIDVLFANIDCHTEYKRATAAIQVRRRYYPPDMRRMLDEKTFIEDRGYRFLSHKEHAMLVLTLKGFTLKEIARELCIAETTACTTRKNAFRKMGVQSLVELVKVGIHYNMHHVEEAEYVV